MLGLLTTMGDPVAILMESIVSSAPQDAHSIGAAFTRLKMSLSAWSDERSRHVYGLSTLCPYVLARMCEVGGVSLPGQRLPGGGGGGRAALPHAHQAALFHGLDLLFEIEKAAAEYPTPSLLTTPGSLLALRALALRLHAQGSDAYGEHLHLENVSTPADFFLLLLERLALTPEHGAPRAILHARLLPVALALALGEATARKENWGGRRSLESALALFNEVAGLYFEPRPGKFRGGSVSSILRRSDAALLVDCLVEPQEDLPGAAPILQRLAAQYRWEAAAAGGGAPPRLRPPSPAFQWSPTAHRHVERHPALLRDLLAGPGLSILVSHLCALAVGHWRQWGDRYAGASGGGAGGGEGSEGGAAQELVPSNWPFEALRCLIVRGELLGLYAAALSLHLQAVAGAGGGGGGGSGGALPPAVSFEYALEESSLVALVLALARVLRALRIDHALALARGAAAAAGSGRAQGGAEEPPAAEAAPTLLASVLPALLSATGLGALLGDLLQAEAAADPAACSDTIVSAILACVSALDECEEALV